MEMTITVILHAEEFLQNFETNVTSQESSSYAAGLRQGMALRMLPTVKTEIYAGEKMSWMLISGHFYEKKTRRVLSN